MVAAVYFDRRDKDRRATSFIISGLQTSTNCPDQTCFTDLCLNEFNIQIGIANTVHHATWRHVYPSSAIPSSEIQPLLVSVKNPDQAKIIISSARRLRQSNVSVIRNNVFINANLTKAKATVAYELRCRRRVTAARRAPSGDSTASYAAPPGAAAVLLGNDSTVTTSTLNAAMSSFVQATGSQANSCLQVAGQAVAQPFPGSPSQH